MATLSDAADNFKLFVGGLEKVVKHTIQSNADLVQDFIREQLYSGVNGRGKPLRPTYLNDPFFNSKDAGRWFHNAEGYMKWKMEKTPPAPSYLFLPPRDMKTPNLKIRGDYYSSITAIPINDGLRIESVGVSFGDDIEKKYGSIILAVGPEALGHFMVYFINPALREYYAKFGIL